MRWLAVIGLAVGALALAISSVGPSSASVRSSRDLAGRSASSSADIVQAHPIRGDILLAGPVLLDDRFAVWAEAARHRLLLRSLDTFGRTRTIFSTSRAPGVGKRSPWPFSVNTLAAGGGRVAFVERVMPCASAPRSSSSCTPSSHPPFPWDSTTVFAGTPGHVQAIETVGRCGRPRQPSAAAVSSAGIVVDEEQDICPGPRTTARVVLRSFTGRLIRVLAPSTGCVDCIATLRAAGPWVAFLRLATNAGNPDQATVMRARTGTIGARVRASTIGDVTVDSSGNFALMRPGQPAPCEASRGPDFAQVAVGRVRRSGLAVLNRPANWNLSAATPGMAIAGRTVAFFRPTGRCERAIQVMIGSPGGPFTPVPGVGPTRSANGVAPASIDFDGHLLATRWRDAIQPTATDCPTPSVPVPAHEPKYSPGTTEVVAGFYVQGGPAPVPPCKPEPRGPYAATIRVTSPKTGATVASQTVKDGHLAHIAVAPGMYKLTTSRGATFSPTVKVQHGSVVRQDLFEDVP
jgi:hypothetical protein